MRPKTIAKHIIIYLYRMIPKNLRRKLFSGTVTFLVYHEINPEDFDRHLKLLKKKNYEIVTLDQLYQIRFNEPGTSKRYVVLTFDDGWASNIQLLPILKRQKTLIVMFLAMGLIGTNRKMWNFTLDRMGSDRDLNRELKTINASERNNILFKKNGFYPDKEYGSREFLTWKEVGYLSEYCEFHSHGMFHYPLVSEDQQTLKYELYQSKNILLGKAPSPANLCFAFPYGLAGYREITEALNQGYDLVRGTGPASTFNLRKIGSFIRASDVPEETTPKALHQIILLSEIYSIFYCLKKLFRRTPFKTKL